MSNLVMAVATRYWSGWGPCVTSWINHANLAHTYYVVGDKDVLPAYQEALNQTSEPIIGMVHDDVVIWERGWDERVLHEFNDPGVGVVGFAGAIGHGAPDLYVGLYHLPKLARQNFLSNMRDAEKHGARFYGSRDVAILDGLSIFVRRPILEKVGGWPLDKPVGYFMYSEWLCCEARRQGFRIRVVGVDIDHLGGKSSGWISPSVSYADAHKYFYESNRDVMPYRVKE